jgi:hypothetical protein
VTRTSWLVCALTLALPSMGRADDYHHQGVPLGARAAGLGGAFTALASDGSAIYYNPAGLVLGSGTELSLSTSVYSVARDRTDGDQGAASFRAFPSTFALVKTPFWARATQDPRHRYGVTILVTESSRTSRQVFGVTDARSYVAMDETTQYGAGYAYRPHPSFSIGLSGFVISRTLERFETAFDQPPGAPGADLALQRRELRGSHWGGQVVIGLLHRVREVWSLGLTLRSPSVSLRRTLTSTEVNKVPGIASEATTDGAGRFTSRTPGSARLGLAVRPFTRLLLSADGEVHLGTPTYHTLESVGFAETARQRLTVNVAAGGQLQVAERLFLRAGAYTDRSARAEPAPPGVLDNSALHLLGLTWAVGYEVERATIVAGGAYLTGRSGVDGRELRRDEVRLWVAGSYRLLGVPARPPAPILE